MIQLIPQLRIMLACKPIDFRNGIDGLAALCKRELVEDPFSGTLFVFRNRRGTALKLLIYDGLGYWMITRRLSRGRLRWWPAAADAPIHQLKAQELVVLLYDGLPEQARFSADWRGLPRQSAQVTADCSASPL
jgi:transposase